MLKMPIVFEQCDSQALPFKLIQAMDVKYLSNKEIAYTRTPKRNSRSIYEKSEKQITSSDWVSRTCLPLTKTDKVTRFGLSISSHYTIPSRMTIHDSLAYEAV